jgi:hypothetical protein
VSGKIVLTGAKVYFFPYHILFICSEFHYFVGGNVSEQAQGV